MVTMNKVFLVGNLTRDPELRYTPAGTAVATLRLAVNNMFKGKDGQMQKDTCFINVVVWSKMAEVCNQYLQKGKPVLIEGMLQSRSWQGNDGQKRNVIEVRADRVQFLNSSPQGGAVGAPRSEAEGASGSRGESKEEGLGQEPQEETVNMEVDESGETN
jgi:single-strand DNA-binding protein